MVCFGERERERERQREKSRGCEEMDGGVIERERQREREREREERAGDVKRWREGVKESEARSWR